MDQTEAVANAGSERFTVFPLLFQTFACTMAMMAFVALIGPIARSLNLMAWQVGLAVTGGGIAWIAFARWWGQMSDRRGRRPVMMMGLVGFSISYFLLCLFIDYALKHNVLLWLAFLGLFLGRGLMGLFYAAIPPASAAYIADNVEPDRRGAFMAALGAAGGAGMVFGPGLAGVLSTYSLVAPLYLIAVLPVIALVVIHFGLPPSPELTPGKKPVVHVHDVRLRQPNLVAFISALSVAVAQITVGFFALDKLGLEPALAAQTSGIALAVVGIALVLSQGLLTKIQASPVFVIKIGAIIAALGFTAAAFVESRLGIWMSYGVAAAGMGWVYPSVSAWAANSVESHEQGVAAGTISAMQGLGVISGPLIGSLLYELSPVYPYLFIGFLITYVFFLLLLTQKR